MLSSTFGARLAKVGTPFRSAVEALRNLERAGVDNVPKLVAAKVDNINVAARCDPTLCL